MNTFIPLVLLIAKKIAHNLAEKGERKMRRKKKHRKKSYNEHKNHNSGKGLIGRIWMVLINVHLKWNTPWKIKLKRKKTHTIVIKLMTNHDCGVDLFCLGSQIHDNLFDNLVRNSLLIDWADAPQYKFTLYILDGPQMSAINHWLHEKWTRF